MHAEVEALPGGVNVYGAYLNHPYFWGSKPIGSKPIIGFEETTQSLIWNFTCPDVPDGVDKLLVHLAWLHLGVLRCLLLLVVRVTCLLETGECYIMRFSWHCLRRKETMLISCTIWKVRIQKVDKSCSSFSSSVKLKIASVIVLELNTKVYSI
ncbi:hypothetical protein VNO77_41785 [Canavalia gladiata]|uniref:Uncharacterized protein n=1 Tax=Canavalia gladiata TaxID=3824 RepID=A0AAN9JZ37_CANGL